MMSVTGLESVIDRPKNGNGGFNLDANLKEFAEATKYEIELPSRLRLIFLNHGYANWKRIGFNNIRDLILSYRNGINWSEKSRKRINCILQKYGFQKLASKKYARV